MELAEQVEQLQDAALGLGAPGELVAPVGGRRAVVGWEALHEA